MKSTEAPCTILGMPAMPKLADAAPGSLQGPQTLCLNAIFKEHNAAVVRRALESVRPFVSAWRIVDFGCTEEVCETIRDALRDVPGELIARDWPGRFDVARNWALDLARESGCTFALFIDADDFVQPQRYDFVPAEGRTKLRALPPITVAPARWQSLHSGVVLYRETIARLDAPHRWSGRVHERLTPVRQGYALPPDYIVMCTPEGQASEDMAAKTVRYNAAIEQRVAEDPRDAAALVAMGLMHVDAGRMAEARACRDRAAPLAKAQGVTLDRLNGLLAGAAPA